MRAFITGITGQDGSYLAEMLLDKGYEVHGVARQTANLENLAAIRDQLHLYLLDLDSHTLTDAFAALLHRIQPMEVYHLAAQSHVGLSFSQPVHTGVITGLSTAALLQAVKTAVPDARYYQASTSELFGDSPPPQTEVTPFQPRSPYAAAKLYGYWLCRMYREQGLFACNGILNNHESPRRGLTFVTRKITDGVARIVHGKANELRLGNLAARRDWGHARDYMRAAWLMLQHDRPDDFVIGTGEAHTVGEFVQLAFDRVGLDWNDYVVVDERFFRPLEVNYLQADATKAKRELGWKPLTTFAELVEEMVDADLRRQTP